MSKHTPGPWEQLPEEFNKSYIRVRGTRLGYRYKIANVIKPQYEGYSTLEDKETRANASLIAAAPDLLEALKYIAALDTYTATLVSGQTRVYFGKFAELALPAIAKAEGQQ